MGTSADKFQYLADTKDLIKTAIIGKGQTISSGDTFRSYATKIGNISSECTAVASNILSGKTAYSGGSKITGTIASKGAQTYSPSTSVQTIASGQYLSGTQTINPVVGTAVVGDVLSGKTFNSASGVGITGTMTNRGDVASTITAQGGQYTVPSGYHSGSGKITASFANLSAGNIKSGVNVGGVVGTANTIDTFYSDYIDVKCSNVYAKGWAAGPSGTTYGRLAEFSVSPQMSAKYNELIYFKYVDVIGGNFLVNSVPYVGSLSTPWRFNFSTTARTIVSGSTIYKGTVFVSTEAITSIVFVANPYNNNDAFYYDYNGNNSTVLRLYYDKYVK